MSFFESSGLVPGEGTDILIPYFEMFFESSGLGEGPYFERVILSVIYITKFSLTSFPKQ